MGESFTIVAAKTEKDFSQAKVLFMEYAKELNMDLCFQNFDKELREISIQYNKPNGVLLLLKYKGENVGCVGIRRFESSSLWSATLGGVPKRTPSEEGFRMGSVSEMKRMYIRKEFREKGLSKKLLKELLNRAKNLGYKSVRLDTLPQMNEAIGLYSSFGFIEIKPYRFNPVQGTKYMELKI